MTRKQAIQEAVHNANILHRDFGEHGGGVNNTTDYAVSAASHAYDLGRIAGLREAAKIVDPPPDNPCVGAEEYAIAADWLKEAAGQLRERADRLEKKARAKK